MPFIIRKNDEGKHCVYTEGTDGNPKGEPHGCHATEDDAKQQQRALYVNVPDAKAALKFVDGSEDEIEGLLLPYGGHLNGRDNSGEWFSTKTDFALEWFNERPLLYHHGLDPDAGIEVVGRIKSIERTDAGGWMRAQLDKAHRYYSAVKQLIEEQALGLSSGAMAHLVRVAKTGHIDRWPVVEGSLTPTPCNLLATVDFATAKSHYKAAGLELPDTLKAQDAIKALAGSYEELRDELHALVNPPHPIDGMEHDYAWIEATFPDHIIVSREKDGKETHWRIDYTIGENGKPALGEAQEVETAFVPKKAVDRPLTVDADTATRYAATLLERTRDLQQRRLKEGRVISASNRRRLGETLAAMQTACDELQKLLESTEPQTAKAASVWRQLMARNIDAYASRMTH